MLSSGEKNKWIEAYQWSEIRWPRARATTSLDDEGIFGLREYS